MIGNAIANKLAALGLGTVGTDIFIGQQPITPDSNITVLETNGTEADPDIPLRNPTFQILIRNSSYETGRAKLDAIRNALHQLSNFTQDSVYFYFVLAVSDGGSIGRDDNNRQEFSINFRAKVRTA